MVKLAVESASGDTFQCSHGGTYKIVASSSLVMDGNNKVVRNGDTISPGTTPCPYVNPSTGNPSPCVFNPAIGSSSKVLIGGVSAVTENDGSSFTSQNGPTFGAWLPTGLTQYKETTT